MRRLAPSIFALCVATGCVENVPLGTECLPGQAGPCIVELDSGDRDPPVEGPPDADMPDTAAPPRPDVDAGTPPDAAASDAGGETVSPPPPLANFSFDFSSPNSIPGSVTSLSNLTSLTAISPWYTCQAIAQLGVNGVRAETGLAAGAIEGAPAASVEPSEGKTFVTIAYSGILTVSLLQQLATPLRAGQRYAFALDVLATRASAQLSLEVHANEQGCLGGASHTLFKSPPITSSSWSTVCVSFTSPADLPYLVLTVEPNPELMDGGTAGSLIAPRLAFDRLREATSADCPNLGS
jgi:hypothetical protein